MTMRARIEQLKWGWYRVGGEQSMADETNVGDAVGDHVSEQARDLNSFDYGASAELFMSRSRSAKRRPKYKRFDTAAEAVRFVVEELPAAVLPGAYLLVAEARFGVEEISHLYQSAEYPLRRAV
jgi:hypothetical protein